MNGNFTSMAWVPCFRIWNAMLTPRVKPLYRFCFFVTAHRPLCFTMFTNRADATSVSELKPPLFLITFKTLISKIWSLVIDKLFYHMHYLIPINNHAPVNFNNFRIFNFCVAFQSGPLFLSLFFGIFTVFHSLVTFIFSL